MRSIVPAPSPSLLLVAAFLGACGPAVRSPRPAHPPAAAVLQAIGDDYAELGRIADSVTVETEAADGATGEVAQVAARNLAGRIGRLRGGFEAITLAMTSEQLERTRSFWVRLAVTEAALGLLYEDAVRLAADPLATAGELHALSSQLAGSLELGRASSWMAAREVER